MQVTAVYQVYGYVEFCVCNYCKVGSSRSIASNRVEKLTFTNKPITNEH